MAFAIIRKCLFGRQFSVSLKAKVRLPQLTSGEGENYRSPCNPVGLTCDYPCNLHTSARACKILEVPSQTEADNLKRLYFNPKCLINELLQPLVDCGMTPKPCVVFTPKLCGQFWRARLCLDWPSKVTISAISASLDKAEENAYLLACDLFKNMGLLYVDDSGQMRPVNQDHVISMLETLHTSAIDPFSRPAKFTIATAPAANVTIPLSSQTSALPINQVPTSHIDNLHHSLHPDCVSLKGGDPRHSSQSSTSAAQMSQMGMSPTQFSKTAMWCTNISAVCPYPFNISSRGPSAKASQYLAVLLTCIKLKVLGLLSNNNHVCEHRLPDVRRRICKHEWKSLYPSRELFDPHYEIYSDASAYGFGAYLLKKGDDRIHWLSNAWSEHFPKYPFLHPRCKLQKADGTGRNFQLDIFFGEFYSVVSACYTWKHRFVGKRVLVWTDNQAVAQLINFGKLRDPRQKRLEKLFAILAATCDKYNIELVASHILRTKNVAADFLSRSNLTAFRQVLPEAAQSMKKTKKLLFWNPLQARVGHIAQSLHEKHS